MRRLKYFWKKIEKKGGNFKFHTEEKKTLEFHFICSFILFRIIIMEKIEYRNHTLFDISAKNASFKMAKIYKFHFGIGERRWHETRSESLLKYTMKWEQTKISGWYSRKMAITNHETTTVARNTFSVFRSRRKREYCSL